MWFEERHWLSEWLPSDGPLSKLSSLTGDEPVAVAVAVVVVLSLGFALLYFIFLRIIGLPCLRRCLLSMEVNAEVAAMKQSVRRAMSASGHDARAIEAAALCVTRPGAIDSIPSSTEID